MSNSRIACIIGIVMAGSFACSMTWASCPPDTLCGVAGCVIGTTPAGTQNQSATPCSHCSLSSKLSYDLAVLTFSASASGFAGDLFAGSATMTAQDVYVAYGPTDGTPLTLSMSIHASASLSTGGTFRNAGGSVRVSVIDGPAVGMSDFTTSVALFDSTGVLTLPVTVGQPFSIQFRASAAAVSGTATFGAACAFVNVPAGVRITSCQGYASAPTAALHASWGRLKRLYR